jgi:hypothetical protein
MKIPHNPCKECIVKPTCKDFQTCQGYYNFEDDKKKLRYNIAQYIKTFFTILWLLIIPYFGAKMLSISVVITFSIWFITIIILVLIAFISVMMEK